LGGNRQSVSQSAAHQKFLLFPSSSIQSAFFPFPHLSPREDCFRDRFPELDFLQCSGTGRHRHRLSPPLALRGKGGELHRNERSEFEVNVNERMESSRNGWGMDEWNAMNRSSEWGDKKRTEGGRREGAAHLPIGIGTKKLGDEGRHGAGRDTAFPSSSSRHTHICVIWAQRQCGPGKAEHKCRWVPPPITGLETEIKPLGADCYGHIWP
jgi:hypothetical protein